MLSRRLRLFTLAGFKVYADATWLLIATLIAWSLATGLFPTLVDDVSRGTLWAMGIGGALGLFASVLVHELAHAAVARRYGVETKGITLFLFGGVAELHGEPPTPKAEGAIAIVGPLTSVAIGALLLLAAAIVPWPDVVMAVLAYLGWLNLILAAFNLLPAFPLDGGRVLRAVLWARRGDLQTATRTSARVGGWFGAALMGLGLLRALRGDVLGGVWFVLIGMFLRGAARAASASVAARGALADEDVGRFVRRDVAQVAPTLPLGALVDDYVYVRRDREYAVVDGGRAVGVVSTADLGAAPRPAGPDSWRSATVQDVMRPIEIGANAVRIDEPAAHALDALMQRPADDLVVVDRDGAFLGMLYARDLMAYLERKREVEDATRRRAARGARFTPRPA